MKLETGDIVLVCNGGSALLLKNMGDDAILNLQTVRHLEQDNPPSREQGADRPGRMPTPTGGRSAVETTDLHEQSEEAFLARVAQATSDYIHSIDASRLVIICDARSLGRLRATFAQDKAINIVAELAKDYTSKEVPEIEHLLNQA